MNADTEHLKRRKIFNPSMQVKKSNVRVMNRPREKGAQSSFYEKRRGCS